MANVSFLLCPMDVTNPRYDVKSRGDHVALRECGTCE